MFPKPDNELHWQVEKIGGECLGTDDPPALVRAIFEQHEESITRLVSRRLRPEDHEIADVRVSHDVTYELFDADVFSLDGAGEGGPAFQADPDQALYVRRNLFLVINRMTATATGE